MTEKRYQRMDYIFADPAFVPTNTQEAEDAYRQARNKATQNYYERQAMIEEAANNKKVNDEIDSLEKARMAKAEAARQKELELGDIVNTEELQDPEQFEKDTKKWEEQKQILDGLIPNYDREIAFYNSMMKKDMTPYLNFVNTQLQARNAREMALATKQANEHSKDKDWKLGQARYNSVLNSLWNSPTITESQYDDKVAEANAAGYEFPSYSERKAQESNGNQTEYLKVSNISNDYTAGKISSDAAKEQLKHINLNSPEELKAKDEFLKKIAEDEGKINKAERLAALEKQKVNVTELKNRLDYDNDAAYKTAKAAHYNAIARNKELDEQIKAIKEGR